jgi:general secretion pathway protein G
MRSFRSNPGFSLIELLVVMVLIGLLLSIAVPTYLGHIDQAKESVLRQDLAQMRDAIDKYYGDTGVYPESLAEIALRRYLRKIPVDPFTERSDTWVIVAPDKSNAGKVFDVKSGATGRARDGTEYASW